MLMESVAGVRPRWMERLIEIERDTKRHRRRRIKTFRHGEQPVRLDASTLVGPVNIAASFSGAIRNDSRSGSNRSATASRNPSLPRRPLCDPRSSL